MARRSTLMISVSLLVSAPMAVAHEVSAPGTALRVLIDTVEIQEVLEDVLKVQQPSLPLGPERAAGAIDEIKKSRGFDSFEGFSSLFEQNLATLGDQNPPYNRGSEYCKKALEEKRKYHETHGGVPPAYGKIINYGLYRVDPGSKADGSLWAGRIETCTWWGNSEYYFDMRFNNGVPGQPRLVAKSMNPAEPFPGTLDLSGLDPAARARLVADMSQWDWKIHATGEAISFFSAKRDGVELDRTSDPLFAKPAFNCFDLFFKGPEPQDSTLPAQQAFCMGRCDARIINTP